MNPGVSVFGEGLSQLSSVTASRVCWPLGGSLCPPGATPERLRSPCSPASYLADVSDTFRLGTAEPNLEEQGWWHMDGCRCLAERCPPSPTEFIALVPMGQKGCFFVVPGALSFRFPRINHPGRVGAKAGFRCRSPPR